MTDFVLHSAETAAEREVIVDRAMLILTAHKNTNFRGRHSQCTRAGERSTSGRPVLHRGNRLEVSEARGGSPYRADPLRDSYDRTAFHCGIEELDDYFHRRAGQDLKRKVAAPFVMVDDEGTVVGYYTLSAFSVLLRDLPDASAKKLPKYPQLPATLLERLAVSVKHRGRKLGQRLLRMCRRGAGGTPPRLRRLASWWRHQRLRAILLQPS